MEISFSVLSIEDSPSDVEALSLHISANPHFRYLGNANTLAEGKRLLARHRPDLLILDIDLPDGNSMDRLDDLRSQVDWPMHIVFHTVYDHYVIQAMRQQAFDYMVKPFSPEEMDEMLARVEDSFRKRLFKDTSTAIMVSTGDGFCRVDLTKVVYFEHIPKSKYWKMYLPDGSSYTLRKESSYADILPMNPQFVQVSQSTIINLEYLSLLKRDTVTLLPPYENLQIVVSRNYLPGLQSRLLFI